jgi:hypothetical protein
LKPLALVSPRRIEIVEIRTEKIKIPATNPAALAPPGLDLSDKAASPGENLTAAGEG